MSESPWRASRPPPQPPGRRNKHPLAAAAICAGNSELERREAQCVERAAGGRIRIDTALPQQKIQDRSEEHTSELQSRVDLVCRLLLEKKKTKKYCNVNRKRNCKM